MDLPLFNLLIVFWLKVNYIVFPLARAEIDLTGVNF